MAVYPISAFFLLTFSSDPVHHSRPGHIPESAKYPGSILNRNIHLKITENNIRAHTCNEWNVEELDHLRE